MRGKGEGEGESGGEGKGGRRGGRSGREGGRRNGRGVGKRVRRGRRKGKGVGKRVGKGSGEGEGWGGALICWKGAHILNPESSIFFLKGSKNELKTYVNIQIRRLHVKSVIESFSTKRRGGGVY